MKSATPVIASPASQRTKIPQNERGSFCNVSAIYLSLLSRFLIGAEIYFQRFDNIHSTHILRLRYAQKRQYRGRDIGQNPDGLSRGILKVFPLSFIGIYTRKIIR